MVLSLPLLLLTPAPARAWMKAGWLMVCWYSCQAV